MSTCACSLVRSKDMICVDDALLNIKQTWLMKWSITMIQQCMYFHDFICYDFMCYGITACGITWFVMESFIAH